MTERLPLTAAVLAGGRSLRMGVDKTLLPVDGEALVAKVASAVSEVCEKTLIVTNRPEALRDVALPDGACVLSDEVPYQGPLGGLITALSRAEHEWVLAVAADMPFISKRVVEALWQARAGADVVVPVTEKGPEPLLALYSRRCSKVARQVMASGRRRLVAIFRDLNVVEIPVEKLREIDPRLQSFMNVNTPADLALLQDSSETGAQKSDQKVATDVFSVGERSGAGPRALGTQGRPDAPEVGAGSCDTDPPVSSGVRVVDVSRNAQKSLPVERPLTLYLNDQEITTVQGTPSDLEELAAGFFFAEGLLSTREHLVSVDVDQKRGLVYVKTSVEPPAETHRTRLITSGCGKGVTFSSFEHARRMRRVEADPHIGAATLHDLMTDMARSARAYRETGGMHACGLARGRELLLVREDIGRHNAADKVLGRAFLDGMDTSELVMLTTGRISYEMVVKVARAGLAVAASRTAATDQAAEVATALGVTLVGYVRGRRVTIYTHPSRISNTEEEMDPCRRANEQGKR